MGSDLYMEGRHHAEDNFYAAIHAIKEALKALEDGDDEKALFILKKAKKLDWTPFGEED
jgi:hypothetical protein